MGETKRSFDLKANLFFSPEDFETGIWSECVWVNSGLKSVIVGSGAGISRFRVMFWAVPLGGAKIITVIIQQR